MIEDVLVKFTDDCIIGIEQIDDEHRHLFELLNQGMNMLAYHGTGDSYDEIKELIQELDEYAEEHFAHEEAYMKEIRDPELINQRIQHDTFRHRIHNWFLTPIDDSDNQEKLLTEIMQYMTRWLYNHIIASDMMIGKMPPIEEWRLKEKPCEFTDEYLTGIPHVDEEHRILFQLIGQVNDLVRQGIIVEDLKEIEEVLTELQNYTKYHFSDEEEYMRSIDYPELESQQRAHKAFVSKLEELNMEQIKENPQENMERLVEYLTGWLVNHILYADKKIGRC